MKGPLVDDVSIVGAAAIAFVIAMTSTGIVSMYAHRYVAHGAIKTISPLVVAVMRVWIWIATGTNCRRWAAVHIKHHRMTDRQGDPHSPQIASSPFRLGPTANWLAYRSGARDDSLLRIYRPAHRADPDRWDLALFDRAKFGTGLGLVALVVVFGPAYGFGIMFLQAVLYVTNTSIVNSLGHAWGYQRFTSAGARYTGNSFVLSLATGGESFHNNHHGDPLSPYLAHQWWELLADWPGCFLAAASRLRLVELHRRTPVKRRRIARYQLRTTTAIALRLNHRDVAREWGTVHRRRLREEEAAELKASSRREPTPPASWRRGQAAPS